MHAHEFNCKAKRLTKSIKRSKRNKIGSADCETRGMYGVKGRESERPTVMRNGSDWRNVYIHTNTSTYTQTHKQIIYIYIYIYNIKNTCTSTLIQKHLDGQAVMA